MSKKILFSLILFLHGTVFLFSQGLEGYVYNTSKDSIPFVTLYVPQISKGTVSNIEGKYKLDLPQGKHRLIVQILGYKTREFDVEIKSDEYQNMDVILEEQKYRIPEVRILASGEDPAYPIMRKAVALSEYYLNQVEEYNCRVYLKGSGVADKVPGLLKRTLEKEGFEQGKYYVTENITDIHFELPDKINEKVISLRSSGDMNDTNPMGFITVSLYHDINGIISPLSRDAFSYYKYQLVSSFYDRDYLIHQIKVIPRREGFDLYSGHIFIVEGFWHLHSVDLKIQQKMFDIQAKQVYSPVAEGVWMPISHKFDIDFHAMGFRINYVYVASVSDYDITLNSKLDHSTYRSMVANEEDRIREEKELVAKVEKEFEEEEKEIRELVQKENLSKKDSRKLKKLIKEDIEQTKEKPPLEIEDGKREISDSATERTLSYWNLKRPVPLTARELESFKEQDSLQALKEESPEKKDSIEALKHKVQWKDLLIGGSLSYPNNHYFKFSGLFNINNFDYNTVDGLVLKELFRYSFSNDSGRYFRIDQSIGYALSREEWMGDLKLSYRYHGIHRGWLYLEGGRESADFNRNEGIAPGLNIVTTLFFKDNHLKLYERDYFSAGHKIDLVNGLVIRTFLDYENRQQLSNNIDFYLTNFFDSDFTSNVPLENELDPALVSGHQAVKIRVGIDYTPRYYYRISGNVKRMAYSRYPHFSLNYTKGINGWMGSDVDYDQLELSVIHSFNIRKLGSITYQIKGGTFLNTEKMYFADYKHFNTNEPFLISNLNWDAFRFPGYYSNSTNQSYFESHIRFRSDRIIIKHLPIANKTLMNESLYFNYLLNTGSTPYYEIGYGLNQIALMFNFEVFVGFKGSQHEYTGIKLGLPLFSRTQEIVLGG